MKSRFFRFLVVAGAAIVGPLWGWVQESTPDNPVWPNGATMTMQLRLGSSPVLSDGRTWNVNAIEAMQMWNRVMKNLQFAWVSDSPGSSSSGNNVNEAFFAADVFGSSFGTNTLAVTTFWYSGHTMTEADVVFNNTKTWDAYRGPVRYPSGGGYAIAEFRRVALHELGHAIGLGHPDTAGQSVEAVMNSLISDLEAPTSDDRAGAVALYGARTPVSGDFDGDLKSDILWENAVTGDHSLWLMNGTAYNGLVYLQNASVGWRIAATADFNADGHADILWEGTNGRHAVWVTNVANYAGPTSTPELANVAAPWRVAGAADFNGDRTIDLVWENTTTGDRYLWLMRSDGPWWGFASSIYLGTLALEWHIVAAGDFNGDTSTDLVWENSSTGARYLWLMNGTAFVSSVYLGTVSTQWHIAGTGDFNGDGNTDLVWENTVTGERGLWLMNGTNFSSWVSLGTVSTNWRIRN